MADVIGNSIEELDDDFFKNYSKKVKEETEKKAGNSGNSFAPKDYEEIAYAGCDKGFYRVVRLIGAPIGAESQGYKRKPTDPVEILMCDVKDDNGKRFTIKLPLRAERSSDNHVLIRLWDKVMEKTYINRQAVFVNKDKHPELFELISKGGFKPEDGMSYTYAGGLKGDRLSIYNCIDRSDSWCKDNKHSKILARDVNVDDQGRVWGKPGIKSYGSVQKIADIIGKYGSFMKYDLGFERTGVKENPWNIKNASRLKEAGMLEDMSNADGSEVNPDQIVVGPLSDEERGYELYDLDKLFAPTSYTKIYQRIPSFFKMTDATLGTSFEDEIRALSEKEKAKWAADRENAQAEAENKEIQKNLNLSEAEIKEATSPDNELDNAMRPAPAKRSSVASAGLSADKTALLKGYQYLTDDIKSRIKDVQTVDGKTKIVWDRDDDLLECDTCGALSPESATACPVCGTKF